MKRELFLNQRIDKFYLHYLVIGWLECADRNEDWVRVSVASAIDFRKVKASIFVRY